VRRRTPPEPLTPTGVPLDLASGPDIAVWGTHSDDLFGAWHAWKAARDEWARSQGLDPMADYRHLPPELFDRAPFNSENRLPAGADPRRPHSLRRVWKPARQAPPNPNNQ